MNKKKPIRLLIADDHLVIRSGIKAVLSVYSDIDLVGEASNGQEAVELCEKFKPDVVLMDLIMPDTGGIEATTEIIKKQPDAKVIILSSFKDSDLVEGSLKAGAISYLMKNASAEEIVEAIRDAYDGKSVISSEVTQVLVSEMKKQKATAYNLTRREKEILALMVEGLSNKEIAKRLVVSNYAVKFHVSNILNKLGVYSRSGAVSLALKQNLVI
jgi:NarL family two-component system response regulator LiaR